MFHIDQCEDLTPKHETVMPEAVESCEIADTLIADYLDRTGVLLQHQAGDKAYYQPASDTIVIPERKQFAETAEYYGVIFHEITHSTSHKSRLNRLDKTAFFGTESYSKEELIAEIGAATLVKHCGIETSSSFRNSAAYLQNWLQVLKNDKRFIVSAAGKAEKAVQFILNADY